MPAPVIENAPVLCALREANLIDCVECRTFINTPEFKNTLKRWRDGTPQTILTADETEILRGQRKRIDDQQAQIERLTRHVTNLRRQIEEANPTPLATPMGTPNATPRDGYDNEPVTFNQMMQEIKKSNAAMCKEMANIVNNALKIHRPISIPPEERGGSRPRVTYAAAAATKQRERSKSAPNKNPVPNQQKPKSKLLKQNNQ